MSIKHITRRLAVLGFFLPSLLAAQTKPIQISLVTPIQIVSENDSIAGVRLNLLYGRNVSVVGLDLGLVNHSTGGHSKGIQGGLVGLVDGDFSGWQGNAVNITKGRFLGFQQGAVNSLGTGEGVQAGWVNVAQDFNGVQIGLINWARNLEGLQIGLINIIRNNGVLPVMPLINWSF